MSTCKIFVHMLLLTFSLVQTAQVCFNVPDSSPSRPGKRGPVGPAGPKGDAGECKCNNSEITLETIRPIQEKIKTLDALILNVSKLQDRLSDLDISVNKSAELCTVGMEDGRIKDDQITASSFWNNRNDHRPKFARLGLQGYGIWASHVLNTEQWIQVDFGRALEVTGVVTQGRRPGDSLQWVASYKIATSLNNVNWIFIPNSVNGPPKVFQGNTDRDTRVTNFFPEPVEARYARLYPVTYHGHIVIRLEYLTC